MLGFILSLVLAINQEVKMVQVGNGKRSYLGMLLSLILPGLGQIYLGKWLRGLILFFGVALAGTIIYLNSLPVDSWEDLMRFDDFTDWWKERRSDNTYAIPPSNAPDVMEEMDENSGYHLWTFENGKKLMYRPSWKLKLSGLAQGIFFWLYAVCDGWRGEKGFNKRAFKSRLRKAKNREEVEAAGNKQASKAE